MRCVEFFIIIIIMIIIIIIMYNNEWENVLSKNRGVILNRAKDYYQNDKERLRE